VQKSAMTFRRPRQSGAALVTALVMLVLVTILALSSMTTTTMDERMAANSQELNKAFQAAETGLSLVYNDEDAFSTTNTESNPYDKTEADLGGSGGLDTDYKSIFRQQTVPPRGSGWDNTMAYYHFDLSSTGTTAAGATSRLHLGAYQVGKKQ
jgi:type IV pilus assembly protein PilX